MIINNTQFLGMQKWKFEKLAMSPNLGTLLTDMNQATFMQDLIQKILWEYVGPNCNLTYEQVVFGMASNWNIFKTCLNILFITSLNFGCFKGLCAWVNALRIGINRHAYVY